MHDKASTITMAPEQLGRWLLFCLRIYYNFRVCSGSWVFFFCMLAATVCWLLRACARTPTLATYYVSYLTRVYARVW